MAISARWLPVPNAAKVLGIPVNQLQQMIANGQVVTQKNGNVLEVGLHFDPKQKPQYKLMPVPPPPPPPPPKSPSVP